MLRTTLKGFPNQRSSGRIRLDHLWRHSRIRWQARSASSTAYPVPAPASSQEGVLDGHEKRSPPSGSAAMRRLRDLVPFCQFSSSVYSVPVLLIFRLFYQAVPFELNLPALPTHSRNADLPIRNAKVTQYTAQCPATDTFLGTYATINTAQFCSLVREDPELSKVKLKSMTWVKALASPLSHEYIQFIVENDLGSRYRLAVERSDWGDLVTVGWNWGSGEYASHHHVLPLPLLTLSFELCSSPPTLCEFAQILSETSATQGYRLFREMCWWYAERVFIRAAQELHGARFKQWAHASLRYSFVVRTKRIHRLKLVGAAEDFRKQNICGLRY